jgi:hypothetical protein
MRWANRNIHTSSCQVSTTALIITRICMSSTRFFKRLLQYFVCMHLAILVLTQLYAEAQRCIKKPAWTALHTSSRVTPQWKGAEMKMVCGHLYVNYSGAPGGGFNPPPPRNFDKVPKIKKTLLYEMKFLVPNYSCLQNLWLGGHCPQIPVLSVLNWICWTPPNKIPGYATG